MSKLAIFPPMTHFRVMHFCAHQQVCVTWLQLNCEKTGEQLWTHISVVTANHLPVGHLQKDITQSAGEATPGGGGKILSSSPGCRCSNGAHWGRRSNPLDCWPRPQAALRPVGRVPAPGPKRRSRTRVKRTRMMTKTGGWMTWCCSWKHREQVTGTDSFFYIYNFFISYFLEVIFCC